MGQATVHPVRRLMQILRVVLARFPPKPPLFLIIRRDKTQLEVSFLELALLLLPLAPDLQPTAALERSSLSFINAGSHCRFTSLGDPKWHFSNCYLKCRNYEYSVEVIFAYSVI